jgi:ADP-heptose:LPS heptosyltransferase
MQKLFFKFFFYTLFSHYSLLAIKYIKPNFNKIYLVSDAGYGDLLYAAYFARNCPYKNIILYCSEEKLDFAKLFYSKSYAINDLPFNSRKSLYYSDRSDFSISQLIKFFINGNFFISNSIYERLRVVFRIKRFFNYKHNKKFYNNLNCLSRYYEDFYLFTNNINYQFKQKEIRPTKKENFTILHAFGSDSIRHLTKEQITMVAEKFNNLVLIGTMSDYLKYKKYNLNYVFYVQSNWVETVNLIRKASFIVCVDSSIAHLSRFLTNVETIVLVGNTFAEYYYPFPEPNLRIIHNYQPCTPCSNVECNKIKNKSCVQNIII